MIPTDSILRNLPEALPAADRVRLDALVYSTDVAFAAYDRMRSVLLARGTDRGELPHPDRVDLFSAAWTIIDQVDFTRQIAEWARKAGFGENAARFVRSTEPVRLLRNKMDHFNSNVRNLAERKGSPMPAMGVLSYFVVDPHVADQARAAGTSPHGIIITIPAGTLYGDVEMPSSNPLGKTINLPVGDITFSAFDRMIAVDELMRSLDLFLHEAHGVVETRVHAYATTQSEATGLPVDKFKSGGLGGVVISVELRPADGNEPLQATQ